MNNSAIYTAAFALGLGISGHAVAQTCVEVNQVDLSGVTLIPQAQLQAGFNGQLGCIGLEGLNVLLESVTLAYVDAGYIAARAYLPEQDLSDGTLTISVVEGQVSDIIVEQNGLPAPLRAATAFPGMVNRPLELRRLEQGLAQINRLPSSDATSQLVPGAESGDSIVAVAVTQGRPWSASVAVDNRGTPSTGAYNYTQTFGYDNLFGLNDSWTVSYQRSMEPGALAFGPNTPVGNSYSLSGSLPNGFWTYGVSWSASDYVISIPGVTGPLESTGQSQTVRFSAERLLSLSEDGRWDAGVALRWAENENQILGARIDTSSRALTVFDAYLSRSQPLFGGQLDATLTLRNGLPWFGAFDDASAPAGSPAAQYTAFLLDASYQRAWEVGERSIVLLSRFTGQTSEDNLFGSEQFSIGGFSSVRGSRTSLLFGNTGVQLINTLSLPGAWSNSEGTTLTPYIGLDAGHIFEQTEFGISGGSLMSYSVGFTLNGRRFNIDAVYSEVLSAPSAALAPNSGLFSVQARFVF